MPISDRIQQARREARLTQSALASLAGVGRRQVAYWEAGDDAPSAERLPHLAKALGVSTDWLLTGETSLGPAGQDLLNLVKSSIRASAERETSIQLQKAEETLDRLKRRIEESTKVKQELPEYRIAWAHEDGPGKEVSTWLNLAAGHGGDLELAETPVKVIDPPPGRISAARVLGDSMLETLKPSDFVILRELAPQGKELPSLDVDQARNPADALKRVIRQHGIYVLSINDEQPVVKRVCIAHGRPPNWHCVIIADNRLTPAWPYVVAHEDKVVFYAEVVGLGKMADAGLKLVLKTSQTAGPRRKKGPRGV